MESDVKQLALESLQFLNGGDVRDDFDQALADLIADCINRPGIDEARELTLKLKLSPNAGSAGCESVDVEAHVGSKKPGYAAKTANMSPRSMRGAAGPMLVFDAAYQPGLFDEE